jgi:ubiquinone/menaquinone biosynthesis C-methylase UbiE
MVASKANCNGRGVIIDIGRKKMPHSSKDIIDYLTGNAQRLPSKGDSQ